MAAKKKSGAKAAPKVSRKDLHEAAPLDVSPVTKHLHDGLEKFLDIFPYPNGTTLEASGKGYLNYTPSARLMHAAVVRAFKGAIEKTQEMANKTKFFE